MFSATGLKLLFIEPCDDFRSIMTVLLEIAGCEVRSASNATMALDIAAMFQPNIILTELAGLGGFQIAQQLKTVLQAKEAHIIALTSFYWIGIEAEAIDSGFTHYLLKPAKFESLTQVLTSLAMLHGYNLPLAKFDKRGLIV